MNILFAFAHPDDEAFGPAGTIAKLVKEGHSVSVVAFCRGDRHGKDEISAARIRAFKKSCEILGAVAFTDNEDDFTLNEQRVIKQLGKLVDLFNPDVVYTHNINDLHCDHKIVAQAALVVCRPGIDSGVRALYMCETPAATDWTFNTSGGFTPNVYVDVTEYIEQKKQVLSLYGTEIHKWPDPRSLQGMVTLAQYRGQQISTNYAEAFQLVFSHDRKTQ